MVPISQKLQDAAIVYNAAFAEGVEALKQGVDITWPGKTEKVTMPGTEESVHGFLCEMPLFKKWSGSRDFKRPKTGSYSLKVDLYDVSWSIGRDDLQFDRWGLLTPTVRGYGVAQARFYEDLVTDLQAAGKTTTCFDGQNFYDVDHPQGLDGSGSIFKNLWTGMAPTMDNITTVFQYMCQIKDANGKRFGIRPNVFEYGPGYMNYARLAFNAELIAQAVSQTGVMDQVSSVVAAASQSNVAPFRGLVTPMLNPNLEDGVWYLHDTRVMKPFLLQEETPPTGLMSMTDLTNPAVFMNREFYFAAEARAGAGVTLPHLSSRVEEA